MLDEDTWENWVLYLLEAVGQTSGQTITAVQAIKTAIVDYKQRIPADYKFYSQDLIDNLFMHPYTKIELCSATWAYHAPPPQNTWKH